MTVEQVDKGVALITGGGGGIGGATAIKLAESGVTVALADKNMEMAEKYINRIEMEGGKAAAFGLDVTDVVAVTDTITKIETHLGPINQLVNTAGTFDWAAVEDISDDEFEEMFRVHVFGMHRVCRAVLPGMQKRNDGAIVNITSIHAIRGQTLTAHYSAAKGAILSYTKSLAREKSAHGIRVNAVAPGPIDTPLWRGNMTSEEIKRKMAERSIVIPMARLGTPDEVAAGIVFLLSREASYLTGHIMTIDGGEIMN